MYGKLVDLDEKRAVIESPRLGTFHVSRSQLLRIDCWRNGADLIYMGPNGLMGWHKLSELKPQQPANRVVRGGIRILQNNAQPPAPAVNNAPENVWHEESGHLVADGPVSALVSDPYLRDRAVVEFEISWNNKPDFVFALGVHGAMDEKAVDQAFRFEVWEDNLVIVRETELDADVASIRKILPGPGRIQLRAYLDRDRGRILVYSSTGAQNKVADLTVSDSKPKPPSTIFLGNKRGDIRVERLRVSRWDGTPPLDVQPGKSRIHKSDGSTVYAQVERFDAASKEFVVKGDDGEMKIGVDTISSVYLSPPNDEPARTIRAVYHDGTRISGGLTKVTKGELLVKVPGVDEIIHVATNGLRSLISLRPEKLAGRDAGRDGSQTDKNDPIGALEVDGVKLAGRLENAREADGASCLSWKPVGSTTASPLRPGVSGRIVYKEPAPKVVMQNLPQRPVMRQPAAVNVAQAFLNITLGNSGAPGQPADPNERRSLYLRTGDIIPSAVTKIDEDGVWFKTPLSDNTFVAHDKMKAVELAHAGQSTVKLNKTKRDRLLTLPRMQRDSPPTQLIRSVNGDYLRGRIVGMDDKALQVEVRLETKDVPRDRIARIIWLHADELDAKKAVPPPPRPGSTRVHAQRTDGIRLTFFAEGFADHVLTGKSDVLGACRLGLGDVDQILFGDAIEKSAAELTYQQWKLTNASEPKAFLPDASGSGGGPSGMESALVGKPAPDFSLDLLGGNKRFKLSDNKGQIVVLDFWATWCGPCLQSMPQVERVTKEFRDQGVKLIAVNLQEAPKQISSMLERHKLDMTVALDIDGAVAGKYGANAIPQTVIIDKEGKVARLFVGASPHFDEQLREALKAVLSGNKEPEAEGQK